MLIAVWPLGAQAQAHRHTRTPHTQRHARAGAPNAVRWCRTVASPTGGGVGVATEHSHFRRVTQETEEDLSRGCFRAPAPTAAINAPGLLARRCGAGALHLPALPGSAACLPPAHTSSKVVRLHSRGCARERCTKRCLTGLVPVLVHTGRGHARTIPLVTRRELGKCMLHTGWHTHAQQQQAQNHTQVAA